MRRTATLTALLLGAALLAPTGAASAAGETCRGEAATIVGTGEDITGTAGRDVIVTGTANFVDAGAGDDLVCATGSNRMSNFINLQAGPGNDAVDSTQMDPGIYLSAYLGEGADTLVGGAGSETVHTGAGKDYAQGSDTERDLVDTGDGGDAVHTGQTGQPNADEVRLGDGFDSAHWRGVMAAGGVLDGGISPDSLWLEPMGATYFLNLPADTATADGVQQLAFTGFSTYSLRGEAAARIEIVGTTSAEIISYEASAVVDARLDSGNDRFEGVPPLAGSTIDMGAGHEGIALRAPNQRVDLDLEDHLLQVDGQKVAEVTGVENAYVIAREVRLEGDRNDNSLYWRGCNGRLEGGAGDDHLETTYDVIWETRFDCASTKVVMVAGQGKDTVRAKLYPTRIVGGGGNDRLDGSSDSDVIIGGGGRDRLDGKSGNDTLRGGSGRDKAIGNKGRDRCRAEVEKSCER